VTVNGADARAADYLQPRENLDSGLSARRSDRVRRPRAKFSIARFTAREMPRMGKRLRKHRSEP